MKICQAVFNVMDRTQNCQHTKAITPKVGKTRVTVDVFYISSQGVKRLCKVS